MSGSREAILAALRAARPPPSPLPEAGPGIRYPDPAAQFAEAVAAAGGACLRVPDLAAASAALAGLRCFEDARRVASLVPGVGAPNVDLASIPTPHGLEGIDVAILPGEIAVAENGAVWIEGDRLGPHRAILVLPQHLVVVVPASGLVHEMHQAYQRIRFDPPRFGLFLAGPSKTADIEQVLVVGAHGARSTTVLLVG
ncbi:MAG TPA: LUD domain-containing protein [Anaeromyxobacteraceae bacterium]|nr:LUD domain-containing protein [Anaeromyxobacteraceae bacterium]